VGPTPRTSIARMPVTLSVVEDWPELNCRLATRNNNISLDLSSKTAVIAYLGRSRHAPRPRHFSSQSSVETVKVYCGSDAVDPALVSARATRALCKITSQKLCDRSMEFAS
jgi:hypothetical protein